MPGYSPETRDRVLKAMNVDKVSGERNIAAHLGLSKATVHLVLSDEKAGGKRMVTSDQVTSSEEPENERVTAGDQEDSGDQPEMTESTVEEILRPRQSKKRVTTPLQDLQARNEMLEARVIALTHSMQSAYSAAARGSVAGDSVAGRPSLASFREETWRRFAGTVIGLPQTAIRLGREKTIELVMGTLLADLAVLALGPPPTPDIAKSRSATEHLLSDRAKLAVLIGNDSAGHRMRTLLLQSAVKYYFAPSVQRLFEKSIETLLPSDLMGGNQMG